jgi:beta-glucosidase
LPRVRWGDGDTNLELIDLRGLSYDDPAWSFLLSRMSLSEAITLAKDAGYKTASVSSIHKPATADRDGPAGLNTVSGHFKIGYTYPCALLMAETWNPTLAESKGNLIGEDCLKTGVSGWYGPAENIHRTPFGGRNFEYYSEDPLVSAEMAKGEVVGSAKKGVFAYLKHFALNNQETHREKEGGLCTYVREQTIRELYLKAFEDVIKGNLIDEDYYAVETDGAGHIVNGSDGQPVFTKKTARVNACSAVMSSFVRLGQTWAGGCYPLITSLLEKEWGFHGAVLTDYYHSWFMSSKQAIQAGGSLVLDPEKNAMICDANDVAFQYQLQQAAHRTLYCIANSNAMNGYVHGVKEQSSWPKYKTYVICVDVGLVLLSCGCGVGIYFILRPKKRKGDDVAASGK